MPDEPTMTPEEREQKLISWQELIDRTYERKRWLSYTEAKLLAADLRAESAAREQADRDCEDLRGRLIEAIEMRRRMELERDEAVKALAGLMPDSPWDVDQDCRYCSGHYDWHQSSCRWVIASQVLGQEVLTCAGDLARIQQDDGDSKVGAVT